jgi:hypothetical protein
MTEKRGDESSRSYSDYTKSLQQEIRDQAHSRISARRGGPAKQGIVVGVLIIAAGVLLFLDNIGLLRFHNIWEFWPVGLIALGVAKLLDCRGISGRAWASLWILFGTALLLCNLRMLRLDWDVIWPLGIVGVGVMMLVNALERRSLPAVKSAPLSGISSSETTFNAWATFGAIKRRIETQNFQGGEAVAVFGGVELDLRRAVMAPGVKEVVIDANATFGGIEIRAPEAWLVVTQGLGIFGGYEDKTVPPRTPEGDPPRLVIKGYAVFGGVTVRN